MKEYLIKNYKIYLSIIISFIFVSYILPFFMTPGKLTQSISYFSSILNPTNLIKPFSFSKIITYKVDNNSSSNNIKNEKEVVESYKNNNSSFFNLPSVKPQEYNPNYFQPTSVQENNSLSPTVYSQSNIPSPTNNLIKTPTTPAKPSKPSPTPLAPPEYLRPGTGLDDIFKKAGELACVPSALLKAFVAQEAPGVLNWTDQQALFYNAYDWWHRVKTLKEVCAGYGWYPETGLVAEDSLFANEKCKEPFSAETANDTYSKSLGATMMLKSYWDKYYSSPTKQKLKVTKVDRRVLIDSLIGFGIHLRQDSGYTGGCDSWDVKSIAKAACVNTGISCEIYNYCYTICNNYNKYSGKSNNCNNVTSYFVSGTCTFK